MAEPGTYRDVRHAVILADDGTNTATIELRRMAPNGHFTIVYTDLEHDDGFPDTIIKATDSTEVKRLHYRGPSEAGPAKSSKLVEVGDADYIPVFEFSRVIMASKGKIRYLK